MSILSADRELFDVGSCRLGHPQGKGLWPSRWRLYRVFLLYQPFGCIPGVKVPKAVPAMFPQGGEDNSPGWHVYTHGKSFRGKENFNEPRLNKISTASFINGSSPEWWTAIPRDSNPVTKQFAVIGNRFPLSFSKHPCMKTCTADFSLAELRSSVPRLSAFSSHFRLENVKATIGRRFCFCKEINDVNPQISFLISVSERICSMIIFGFLVYVVNSVELLHVPLALKWLQGLFVSGFMEHSAAIDNLVKFLLFAGRADW